MDNITANESMPKGALLIKVLTYILLGFYFLLNFNGSPLAKWVYPTFILSALVSVALYDLEDSIIPLMCLCFVEGQGRVLWSYHPVMRIIFDFSMLLAFVKAFIQKRYLFPVKRIPQIFLFIMLFHFLWFIVQLFNVKNVGFFGVLAAAKVYIFPFFLFFLFLMQPLTNSKRTVNEVTLFICIIFILEGLLSIHQMKLGEEFLYRMSGYYRVATKEIFVGIAFRPFGTSHLPGAMSTYFMLSIPFLFLSSSKSVLYRVLMTTAIIISLFALFIMQVRASLIKEILILIFIFFLYMFNSSNKGTFILKSFIISMVSIVVIALMPPLDQMFPDLNLKMSTDRLLNLQKSSNLSDHRASPSLFFSVVKKKLTDNPLGLGPGRTGAASSISSSIIKNDPQYNMDYSWTHDNLYISLAIDLGFGMIFYMLLIFGLPLALIYYAFLVPITSDSFRLIMLSAITPLISLLGNWGALGIPYNPESFFFWFWIAFGLNEVNKVARWETLDEKDELKNANNLELVEGSNNEFGK